MKCERKAGADGENGRLLRRGGVGKLRKEGWVERPGRTAASVGGDSSLAFVKMRRGQNSFADLHYQNMQRTIFFCLLLSLSGAASYDYLRARRRAMLREGRRPPSSCPACASSSRCGADSTSAAVPCPDACPSGVDGTDNATALALGVLRGEGLQSAAALVFVLADSPACSTVAASALAQVRASGVASTATTADLTLFFWALASAAPVCDEGAAAGVIERAFFDYVGGFGLDVAAAPVPDRLRVSTAAAAQWKVPRATSLGAGYFFGVLSQFSLEEAQFGSMTAKTPTSAGSCAGASLADPTSNEQCVFACTRVLQSWARANLVVQVDATMAAAPTGTACMVRGTNLALTSPQGPLVEGSGILCRPGSAPQPVYALIVMNEAIVASIAPPNSSLTLDGFCNAALDGSGTAVFSSVEECYLAYGMSTCSVQGEDPNATQCSLKKLPEGGFTATAAFRNRSSTSSLATPSDFPICIDAAAANESMFAAYTLLQYLASEWPAF